MNLKSQKVFPGSMIAKCLSMSMHMTVCSKMFEAQKEQTFSLGITVTVGLKKTSSNVYFTGAKVRALYRFKSQGYTSIILYSILYSVFIRFSIKQIIFMVFLRNFTISIN